jgi:hypothetical protein
MVDRIIANLDPGELATLGDNLIGNAERGTPEHMRGLKRPASNHPDTKATWRRFRFLILRSVFHRAGINAAAPACRRLNPPLIRPSRQAPSRSGASFVGLAGLTGQSAPRTSGGSLAWGVGAAG